MAIITVLKEEYEAVRRCLGNVSRDPGTTAFPNVHSWAYGTISSPTHDRPYQVVLGIAARPGSDSGNVAVANTINRYDPSCVILVGIAGGLRDVALGDVVVSDRIWGYEYGKIALGYEPRPDWNLPADNSLVAAATTFEDAQPNWYQAISSNRPVESSQPPKVVVGHIASGDKVVDNASDPHFKRVRDAWKKAIAVEMEGIGAISAIQNARDIGHQVGFCMIRGISDIPHRDDAEIRDGRTEGDVDSESSQTLQRDSWKKYASESAAVVAIELVRSSWPRAPREA